ncbi:cytochrome c [Bradyrhizobium elkanii]|uniref:cytochrome c n=1 Tax=Bradyrhizobium elkanii TaxID=29448 RepID=UPI0020A1F0A2|nr:cytochrome c [Bradyrhizobium elkanii]MCP1973837.1 mono/diheme cytochrome c family protein [Bradyrhizobium elkanii]MCS3520900.1 mono/diheme cytochrome c family protein [Bradyrhizobium elkanii]MCS4068557.1 mono/diheme cytochrome c family protein [Bradyrhizobium elkanii]MCS4084091.1 mono/diheme cytochrome c family protein [Bradyrhizobium elkanii]MCS4104658.1 mono/diheme cytochrome c family protein [Bradyrhizobium elkanii]
MTGQLRIITGIAAIVLVAGSAVGLAVAWRPQIAAIAPPRADTFDPDVVKRGRELAAIGNCNTCHTVQGGATYAGGLPVPTPFGIVFSSNITPDAETGIGRWPEEAFVRAMRSGVARDGQHLYPTFPYDHFTNVSDADDRALYAFLMTRQPVHALPPANQLSFPLNYRPLIAGWKLLYLRSGDAPQDSAKGAEWNRGAYLVEGLAHCGACHTPRDALGAERVNAQFSGGEVDNWHAYALNDTSHAPVQWTADALDAYLRHGWQADHGTARGPMAEVVGNLATVPDGDVRAIAVYMADISGTPAPDRERPADIVAQSSSDDVAQSHAAGGAIYAAACASCHEGNRALPYGGVNLALSTAIASPDPRNLLNIVLSGVDAVEGERSPIMPGFSASIDDAQMVALTAYLRARFGKRPAWPNLGKAVRDARTAQAISLAVRDTPAESTQRGKP